MRTMIKSLMLGIVSLSLYSCATNDSADQDTKTKIYFTVDPFQSSEVGSRTSVNPSKNYAVTWASGDVIGIFPREGYQEPFAIPADQVGNSSATFDGGYWSTKDGLTYNAYYPFDKANFESAECKTTIPVTYLGQSQTGTECNAGAFDYTYSDWKQASGGSVGFKFHHLGAFLVLTLKLPATATYTSLTLNANSAVIPTKGTYDLTATSPAFTSTETASSLTMTLNSFSGTAGEDATFYMMMPPCDLSSSTLTVTLSTGTTTCTYSIDSQTIQAAHLYKVAGTPKESEVIGTIDGWVTEEKTDENGHEYVDLGLSVKWATCNVGATNPEDYGLYFAWGETTGYTSDTSDGRSFDWASLKYCDGDTENGPFTKYVTSDTYGTVDNLTTLESSDDAAYVNWGGSWRMPTDAELTELQENCTWTWTTEKGVNGYKVTSNKEGYTDKSLFLPAACCRVHTYLYDAGYGRYWSSSLDTDYSNHGYALRFSSSGVGRNSRNRYYGQSVRPVCQ